jgi:hypothetical protein
LAQFLLINIIYSNGKDTMNNLKAIFLATAMVASPAVYAGVITGGDTLDQNGANLLEGYLGTGDLDFTNISNLDAGALASTWHSDVSGYTDVISIYDVVYQGTSMLLGGYSSVGHDGSGYTHMAGSANTNFIFNLTTNVVRSSSTGYTDDYDQRDKPSIFATFGGGHDLYGGDVCLGCNSGGYVYTYRYGGYSYGGDTQLLGTGGNTEFFTVVGLESFTFAPAAGSSPVPEPSIIALMSLGLVGLGLSRRKLKK